jgi:hypothetical protein
MKGLAQTEDEFQATVVALAHLRPTYHPTKGQTP